MGHFCRAPRADTYQDIASGAKASRPGMNRLMAEAMARKFDTILVWKLDRFGRSLVDCLNNIRVLEDYGIRFIAVTQGSTPTSGTRRADFCCTFSGRLRNSKGPLSGNEP